MSVCEYATECVCRKTPLKHHALASHLLSLPRAWRTLFEEPPSVLPSLLVAGRARRFSSGDALSRVIRTLGRAQALLSSAPTCLSAHQVPPLLGDACGREPTQGEGSARRRECAEQQQQGGRRARVVDAAHLCRVRLSIQMSRRAPVTWKCREHRERLNREHEQRVLTTFKHWQLVKQRSETHTVGAGAVAGDASAAGTSAMALKIERIVDEILLFFRRAESLAQVQAFQETKSLRADLRFAGAWCSLICVCALTCCA